MRIAQLVAHNTKDGTSFVYETVPLGKLYLIEDHTEIKTFYNTITAEMVTRDTAFILTNEEPHILDGLIPMELLEVLSTV